MRESHGEVAMPGKPASHNNFFDQKQALQNVGSKRRFPTFHTASAAESFQCLNYNRLHKIFDTTVWRLDERLGDHALTTSRLVLDEVGPRDSNHAAAERSPEVQRNRPTVVGVCSQ
jgi:hypothetical protein